ncbi:MAG TPA: CBS domain-containing protein [Gaiellaceae bacterium]|jgi:CBS domain-containing protein|nr:CBS domain-containing protein [Gaiellaceae bacterium]
MLRPFDLAARSLLIVGGLNALSVAAGKVDLVALATRSRRGHPNEAARGVHGAIAAGALWSLARLIEQQAFPKRSRTQRTSVRKAMTANPATVASSTTAAEAAKLLAREDVGSLPIVDNGKLVGVITDRDLALRVVGEGADPNEVTVGGLASRNLVTVEPEQQLDEALRLMARSQVRRLPVVENGKLVGILAQRDVALEADDARTGDVVEKISA